MRFHVIEAELPLSQELKKKKNGIAASPNELYTPTIHYCYFFTILIVLIVLIINFSLKMYLQNTFLCDFIQLNPRSTVPKILKKL